MEPQPLPPGVPDLPATPLTDALAPGSLTSYGPGSVRLPPAPKETSGAGVALLGWLVPGLGQMATGRPRAGLALLLVILSLFTGGLALTDFSCVDPQRHRLEFVAHSLIAGPTGLTLLATAERRSSASPRWRDLGSLYVVVAGFLNLIAACSAASEAARRNQELRRRHEESVRLALAVARLQALARRPLGEDLPLLPADAAAAPGEAAAGPAHEAPEGPAAWPPSPETPPAPPEGPPDPDAAAAPAAAPRPEEPSP